MELITNILKNSFEPKQEYVIINVAYNYIKERYMNCSKCGSEVKATDHYCPECGENTSNAINKSIYCTKCGYELKATATYCPSCGEDVEERKVDKTPTYTDTSSYYSGRKYYASEDSSAGLVCGIIGLFVFGIILGVIAIVLSGKSNCRNPVASLVLGIIDIIGAIIFIINYY